MDNLIPLARGRFYKIDGADKLREGIQIGDKFYVNPEDTNLVNKLQTELDNGFLDKVRFSINEVTGKRLEGGFGRFKHVKTKLPAPMTIIADDLMKLKMSFHLSIREGANTGDKIYNIWYERV